MAAPPLTHLEAALRSLAADLRAVRAPHALVGGLAVSARVEPRTTRDVDLAIAVTDDAGAEALVFAMQARGYQVRASIEQAATGRLATIRLAHGERSSVLVDLLFASSGIEAEVVAAAETMELVPGLSLPVASRGHLVALKVLSRDDRHRPQDWDDLRALLRDAAPADLDQARTALDLIEARGFQRGRDLHALLAHVLRESGG